MFDPRRVTPILDDLIKKAVREAQNGQRKIKTRVRMLSTHRAGPDDLHRLDYVAGEIYTVPKGLADIFLREGWAKEEPAADDQRTREAEKAKGKNGIRMLSTRKGSPDGIHVTEYEKGEIYYLAKPQADGFVREGWAEAIDNEKPEPGAEGQAKEPKKEGK